MSRDAAKRRASRQRYNQSAKGQAYSQSAARQASKQAYNQSAQGQASKQRYLQSDKGVGEGVGEKEQQDRFNPVRARGPRWSLWQQSLSIPWDTKATGGVVGLTVLQPKFFEQFPDARFHFKSSNLAQQGTFKGVWLNEEHTEWALEKEQQ
jgi:hypothetical protein